MPTASVIYLDEPGARLCKDHGRLIVEKQGAPLMEIPIDHLEQLILIEAVDCTGSALTALLRAGVDVCFVDYYGNYRGRLTGDDSKNSWLRLAQYRAFDNPARRLELARSWVQAKISNQRILLQRANRMRAPDDLSVEVADLADLSAQVGAASSLDGLRGVEGLAARRYFGAFARLLRPPWSLDGRHQHPSPDPVNALLSLGYGLLRRRVETAVALAGLDSTIGFLHETRPGRLSLALDLMEEFRPILADSAALMFLNRQQVRPKSFEDTPDGLRLNETGRAAFFTLFENRLAKEVLHPATARRAPYRRHVDEQARAFRAALQTGGPYVPFVAR